MHQLHPSQRASNVEVNIDEERGLAAPQPRLLREILPKAVQDISNEGGLADTAVSSDEKCTSVR
ncbi:MAG: hypothetical protein ACK2UO_10215 [Caldilineaceae bacterium]